jgi:hypothetical protein
MKISISALNNLGFNAHWDYDNEVLTIEAAKGKGLMLDSVCDQLAERGFSDREIEDLCQELMDSAQRKQISKAIQ